MPRERAREGGEEVRIKRKLEAGQGPGARSVKGSAQPRSDRHLICIDTTFTPSMDPGSCLSSFLCFVCDILDFSLTEQILYCAHFVLEYGP